MTVRRLAPDAVQPAVFDFSKTNDNWADGQIAKYPKGREASAVIPLLWKAQEQAGGWLPQKAIEAVGRKLGMPYMRVFEIATFYTMFNLQPAGTHFVQVCGTVPCHLKGAREIIKVCEDKIGPQSTVTADGKFSWLEVECLGACCNAPMVQINYDYYEDLTPENFAKLLDDLRSGKKVKTGPQVDRSCSEPLGGGETLKDNSLYDGSAIGRGDWQKRIAAEREAAKKAAEAAEAAKAAAAAAAASAPAVVAAPAPPPAAGTPATVAAAAPATVVSGEKDRVAPAAAAPAETAEPAKAARPPSPALPRKGGEGQSATPAGVAPKSSAAPAGVAPKSSAAPAGVAPKPSAAPAGVAPEPSAAPAGVAPRSGKAKTPVAAEPSPLVGESLPSGSDPRGREGALAASDADAPALLAKPRGGKGDDLKLIWGVGPKLEKLLNRRGVWHFDQIAAWTDKELAWIDTKMEGFKGRAVRDQWVEQSKKLATGWRPDSAVGDKPK